MKRKRIRKFERLEWIDFCQSISIFFCERAHVTWRWKKFTYCIMHVRHLGCPPKLSESHWNDIRTEQNCDPDFLCLSPTPYSKPWQTFNIKLQSNKTTIKQIQCQNKQTFVFVSNIVLNVLLYFVKIDAKCWKSMTSMTLWLYLIWNVLTCLSFFSPPWLSEVTLPLLAKYFSHALIGA